MRWDDLPRCEKCNGLKMDLSELKEGVEMDMPFTHIDGRLLEQCKCEKGDIIDAIGKPPTPKRRLIIWQKDWVSWVFNIYAQASPFRTNH